MSSIFTYRGIDHEPGEVNLTRMNIRYRDSPRGKRVSRIDTLYLQGEIMADGFAATIARANAIIEMYRFDYGNAALRMEDGTLTPHGLNNDDPLNMTGVRVVERSWPKGGPEELANMRTFHVTLECEYSDNDDQLISWNETLEFYGNTGPRFEVIDTYFGPFANLECLSTAQRIVQTGSAVGFTANVLPPGPLFPSVEHLDRRYVKVGSGRQQGNFACYFPTWWTYYFTSGSYLEAFPTTL